MTDPARMVVWLRDTMDAAQADAEAAGGDDWRRQNYPSDTVAIFDSKGEPVVYDEGSPTEEQQTHIVRHGPAAVLRQIDRHRKLLDLHENVDGKCDECGRGYELSDWGPDFPCATVHLLAEGWGWTEETT